MITNFNGLFKFYINEGEGKIKCYCLKHQIWLPFLVWFSLDILINRIFKNLENPEGHPVDDAHVLSLNKNCSDKFNHQQVPKPQHLKTNSRPLSALSIRTTTIFRQPTHPKMRTVTTLIRVGHGVNLRNIGQHNSSTRFIMGYLN